MTRNNANHAKSPNRTLFGLGILHFCRLVWERGKVRRLREPLGKAANCIGCKGGRVHYGLELCIIKRQINIILYFFHKVLLLIFS